MQVADRWGSPLFSGRLVLPFPPQPMSGSVTVRGMKRPRIAPDPQSDEADAWRPVLDEVSTVGEFG